MIDLRHGDCLEVLKTLADNSIDAVVTDPPYELGFMGKEWDATGIANNPALWAEVLRVLKPGRDDKRLLERPSNEAEAQ